MLFREEKLADRAAVKAALMGLGRSRPDIFPLMPHQQLLALAALEMPPPLNTERKVRNALKRLQAWAAAAEEAAASGKAEPAAAAGAEGGAQRQVQEQLLGAGGASTQDLLRVLWGHGVAGEVAAGAGAEGGAAMEKKSTEERAASGEFLCEEEGDRGGGWKGLVIWA